MKKVIFWMFMLCTTAVTAGETKLLPAAQKDGGPGLRKILNDRHTVRSFRNKQLSDQQLANILWCANGINRPDGKRTAPSALNKQEVMIFLAASDGGYFYDPAKHLLVKITGKDLRKSCGRYDAPCYLILVPDKAKQSREIFAAVDTGYVSQNIYLAAQSEGLGTCAMGSISDRAELIKELNLGKNTPLLVHPVGFPR